MIKNRYRNAIPTVISRVQSGFQSGKSASDNLFLMCLVLTNFNNNSDVEDCLLVQVDFEKAFDSVDHTFLFKFFLKLWKKWVSDLNLLFRLKLRVKVV